MAGPFLPKLPSKMEDMKDISKLSFTSSREGLAEKFHMSEALCAFTRASRSGGAESNALKFGGFL